MISPPRELRAALPAELRGMRRDGARLCVVERRVRSDHPHVGRSPRRVPRVRGSARRQLEPDAAGGVAGGSRRCRAGAASSWRAPRQRVGRARGGDRAAAPQRPTRARRDAARPRRPQLPRPRRRAPTRRCCGGWLSKAATRCRHCCAPASRSATRTCPTRFPSSTIRPSMRVLPARSRRRQPAAT